MKIIERVDATETLRDYAENLAAGPVVVTEHGSPVAALVPFDNADLETVLVGTNPQFLQLIERSRERARVEGSISSDEMRRRFANCAAD